MATFRHSGSWAVPLGCHCLFVPSGAVANLYPIDGIPGFAKDFAPVIEKGKTLMVLVFTEVEMADKIERLDYRGLIPGRNMAMTDPQGQPVAECPHVTFWNPKPSNGGTWRVNTASQEPLGDSLPTRPTVIDRQGMRLPSLATPDAGVAIDYLHFEGHPNYHNAHLCLFRSPWGFELDVLAYQPLGLVPEGCFSNTGELLPDYRDEDDLPLFPATWGGEPVVGIIDRCFVGPLRSTRVEPAVRLSHGTEAMVRTALLAIGGCETQVPIVQKLIARMNEQPHLDDADPCLTAPSEMQLVVGGLCASLRPPQPLQDIKPGITISQGIGKVEPLSKRQKAPERQPAQLIHTEGSNYVGVVPRGGGLVHWLYHGDEDEGEEA